VSILGPWTDLAARQFSELVEWTSFEEVRLANDLQPLLDVFGVLFDLVYHRVELVDGLVAHTPKHQSSSVQYVR